MMDNILEIILSKYNFIKIHQRKIILFIKSKILQQNKIIVRYIMDDLIYSFSSIKIFLNKTNHINVHCQELLQ